MLGTSGHAVNSALRRARATLAAEVAGSADRERAPLPDSPRERRLLGDFARAFESGDVDAILALLTDDVWMTMPPLPIEYQGLDAVRNFLTTIVMRDRRRYVLVPARANGQPAFAAYLRLPGSPIPHAHGILLLTLAGDRVRELTRLGDNGLLPVFGLPRSLRPNPGRGNPNPGRGKGAPGAGDVGTGSTPLP